MIKLKNILLESTISFKNTPYTDWSDFEKRLNSAKKTGFKDITELLSLMGLKKSVYTAIKDNMIFHWKDSVSKSILHSIENIGNNIPIKGKNIFKDLRQQTFFLYVAGNGLRERDIFGSENSVDGLKMIGIFDTARLPDPDNEGENLAVGGFYALQCADHLAIKKVNEIIQYVWLYVFYQKYKLKHDKIKLPKYLYRGIRANGDLIYAAPIKKLVDKIQKTFSYEESRKKVIDLVLNYIIKYGISKLITGKLLSFTADRSVAEYFSNQEGFILQVDTNKVEIITSEKTEDLFAKKDPISKKKEQEYIIRIPENYKFKLDDFEITDEDYEQALYKPISVVSNLSDGDNPVSYEMNGYKIKVVWNDDSGLLFSLFKDGKKIETNLDYKKLQSKYHFDPKPNFSNVDKIINFKS